MTGKGRAVTKAKKPVHKQTFDYKYVLASAVMGKQFHLGSLPCKLPASRIHWETSCPSFSLVMNVMVYVGPKVISYSQSSAFVTFRTELPVVQPRCPAQCKFKLEF